MIYPNYPKYHTFSFKERALAIKKRKEIKQMYGYTPSIFQVEKNNGRFKFVVIKPLKLRKVY